MHLFILLFICLVLLYMAWQDFVDRAIDWFLYPLLITLIVVNGMVIKGLTWEYVFINLALIAVQLFVLALYFKITKGINLMKAERLLGWGDVLFFVVLTVALSPLNFFAFYLISLLTILLVFAFGQRLSKKLQSVPLAGCQAVLLAVLLLTDYHNNGFNLYDDSKLINFINHAVFNS